MMNLKGIRYFYGCISLRVYGGFSENFINDCIQQDIRIWDIRRINGSVYFFTQEKYLSRITEIAENSGLEVQIRSYFGIPHIVRQNKSRLVLFVGLAVSLLFVVLMNTRIWVIEVRGNEAMFDSEIIEIMEEYGVCIGAGKRSIDAVEIQKKFLERTKDRVLWVSLNIEGMCAEIQIREIEKIEDDSIGQPCNYIADFNGIITTYRVFSGTPVVNRGNYVRAGEMLIDSVVEYYDGELNFVESRGLIIARRKKYVNTKADINTEKRRYKSTEKKYGIIVFGFEIPFYISRENAMTETVKTSSFLHINGVKMPFGISVYTDSAYKKAEYSPDKLYVLKEYLSDVEFQTGKSNVISVKTEAGNATGVYEFKGEIDCLDYMGRKELIKIQNRK